jgi:hypothetical protein
MPRQLPAQYCVLVPQHKQLRVLGRVPPQQRRDREQVPRHPVHQRNNQPGSIVSHPVIDQVTTW